MNTVKKFTQLFIILALLAGGLAFVAHPAAAAPVYVCLPTCETNDGRMLTIAGTDLSTMADQPVRLLFASPSNASSLEIGIFDGDSIGMWDYNNQILKYTLYADPTGIYTTTIQLGSWLSTAMPDNDWFNINITNTVQSRSPSGNFLYYMEVVPTVTSSDYESNFKVRTDGYDSLIAEPFSFISAVMTLSDAKVIYPGYPDDLSVTTYDGTFDFYIYAPVDRDGFTVWDGDMDYGAADLSSKDTDDPDTPNNAIPSWVIVPQSMNFEGVAIGRGNSSGYPSDDSSNQLARRSPSIQYQVTLPSSETFTNTNPSGNKEWEQFRISSQLLPPQVDAQIDHPVPAGVYRIHMFGLDMNNLNSLRFEYESMGVCAIQSDQNNPSPCKQPLYPYIIGDTVFVDKNGDGQQDDGEDGLPGIMVVLQDESGQPHLDVFGNSITATTDANGNYSFNVDGYQKDAYTGEVTSDGIYSVNVDPSNFAPGGALENWISTTGGDTQTYTVVDANILTYDFGYRLPYVLGDVIFDDMDGSGGQDDGEQGILDVTVELLDGSGQVIGTTTTDASGNYSFRVAPGDYTVQIAASNFDAGGPLVSMASTTGGQTQSNTVTDADVLTYDFGYRQQYHIGDTIFNDLDGSGIQDTGEPGISSVTVELLDGGGNVIGTTTTSTDGKYSFTVFSGDYTVRVAASNFSAGATLAGMVSTTGGHLQTRTVSNADVLDYDFGYGKLYNIGDLVFKDCDRNGVQYTAYSRDAGANCSSCIESGIANVTLELIDSTTQVIATTTTDAYGYYSFAAPAGAYSVRVAASNFSYGKPLFGMASTISTNQLTRSVTNADILTYDFPYGTAITNPGTGTIGYWKNHPEAWPVGSIEVGGVTYTRDQAIAMMKTSTSKDKSINLFSQLVAAKLNILIGNASTCILPAIKHADQWLAKYPYGSNISASSAAWKSISSTYTYLDRYNNGLMCAPHRG